MRRQEERKGGIKKQMGQIVNRDKDGRVKRGSHSGPVVRHAGKGRLGRKCGSHGAGVQREAERGHRVP